MKCPPCFSWFKPLGERLLSLNPFFLLTILLIAFAAPVFSSSMWYIRDTVFVFETFYTAYVNLYYHGELTSWLPYASYGFPFLYFQLIYFSGAQYFCGFLGWLLGVQNVDFLFKFSMLLEQWVLLFGTYRLAQTLFRKKASVFLVSLSVMASSLWMSQINWNFRIYSFLPLIIFLLRRFFSTSKPVWFWLSGITFIFSQLGVPGYFGVYQLIVLGFFFLAEIRIHPKAWIGLIERSWQNALLAILTVLLSSLYLFSALHALEFIHSSVPGRLSHSLSVLLSNFLSVDTDVGLSKFAGFFMPQGFDRDNTLYFGLLPVLFFFYSLLTVKKRGYWVFAALFLFFFCLSLGDTSILARTLYDFFPPIRMARYIGTLCGLLRFLALFLAGYGLDQFLLSQEKKSTSQTAPRANGRSVLFLTAWTLWVSLAITGLYFLFHPFREFSPVFYFLVLFFFLIPLILLMLFPGSLLRQGVIICLFLLLDLTACQFLFYQTWPEKWSWVHPLALRVAPFDYQSKRSLERNLSERMKAADHMVLHNRFNLSGETFGFLFYDPITHRQYPNFYRTRSVHELLELRFPHYFTLHSFQDFMNEPHFIDFIALFGASRAKLRFIPDVFFAANREEARQKILSVTDLRDFMVLEGVPQELQQRRRSGLSPSDKDTLTVRHFSLNRLTLDTAVFSEQGNWLFYSDAYHPQWQIFIDGRASSLFRANLAFKAVYVPHGNHRIEFKFPDLQGTLTAYGLALAGLLGMSILILVIGKETRLFL